MSVKNPGKAILKCPSCEKSLVNIGSRVERVHPVPRFIDRHYWKIFLSFLPLYFVVASVVGGAGRGFFLGYLGFMMIPVFGMYILKRMYPVYRVTDCPYCGYHHKLHLGGAPDA